MGQLTVTLSDKSGHREVEVDSLPRNVRAAVADVAAKNPVARIIVNQMGMLYRIQMNDPANVYLDVLAVA